MPIQILAPRLANQIAAGEVVERPASVVKELIENSLDAGATKIEIDIEKGGAKCIRVKDNGVGVCQEQLTLALSRHATSKISHLDDLEAIVSLGFRGEALASVSSVSRLTFTSKPADQDQAWQAIAEGRDMKVHIQPAAHPQGTTVEVLDLFFNTPARRRFLKTEKTEFQHIDELIRRIALSRFEITFILKHNHKIVRQYRATQTQNQQEKRLASICSESFVSSALYFQNSDNALKISGWVSDSLSARSSNDVQYCYINGRMIRDKLINHAIKQVYAYSLPHGKFPGYVIYIECNPDQVDVNVHPSKHEVRFHQARWVHDFIVSTLTVTLNESPLLGEPQEQPKSSDHAYLPVSSEDEKPDSQYEPKEQNTSAGRASEQTASSSSGYAKRAENPQLDQAKMAAASSGYAKRETPPELDQAKMAAYCDFVAEAHLPFSAEKRPLSALSDLDFADILCLIDRQYLLIKLNAKQQLLNTDSPFLLLSLEKADLMIKQIELFSAWSDGEVIAQPLLLPVRVELDALLLKISEDFNELFMRLGFVFKRQSGKLIISKVPALLRQAPVAKIIPELLTFLSQRDNHMDAQQVNLFCAFLVKILKQQQAENSHWTEQSAKALFDLLLSLFSEQLDDWQKELFRVPDLSLLVQGFLHE
ncbi:DNA mismatch repair endonuclease MutL [Psychromonas sp. MB-3u-54]|uniref:DNA mismatch repair endonuclease MutL n=1 Tax=Psychromonas sp. MB-3u-54 TaxID=2058319 RepID=UPI000C3448BE|nr:DNA mismatch repair endonuclease MutL [Psychromonas sp. MB-3u-54]PKH04571.1 DNA mismatch repair endonuclease MutL [Psychromonas sp. MB-3u-54]